MKKTFVFPLMLGMCFMGIKSGVAAPAQIDISLTHTDWEKTDYVTQGPATLVNDVNGFLVGTKTTATGGTNYALDIQTIDSYNFQNATLNYKWKVDDGSAGSSYAAFYNGVRFFSFHFDNTAWFSTDHSWSGSEVIQDNTWLYTQIDFSQTGYDYTVSYTGYGNNDFLHGTRSYTGAEPWNSLAEGHLWLRIVDNHTVGASMTLGEAYLTTPNPVPVPPAAILLASGFSALFLSRRRSEALDRRPGQGRTELSSAR